jgi:hypothetical protein
MAFFLQRRIQPLQARISRLWLYIGSDDLSRVFKQDPEKKDVEKLVWSLTTLTKQKEIPTLTANFFDSGHPLPKVCGLITQKKFDFLFSLFFVDLCVMSSSYYFFLRTTNSWFLTLLSPKGENSRLILLLVTLKPPRLMSAREEMMPWILKKVVALLRRLLLPSLRIKV